MHHTLKTVNFFRLTFKMKLTPIYLLNVLFSCFSLLLSAAASELESGELVVKLEPSGTYYIEKGRDMEIKCLTETIDLNYLLYWTFNGGSQIHMNESKLLIENVQLDHAGEYICVVSNTRGIQSQDKVIIVVNYGPQNFHPMIAMYEEGKALSITCNVQAQPKPDSVSWKGLHDSDLEFETAGPDLVFTSVKKSHAGKYICRSRNTLFLNSTGPTQRIAISQFVLAVTQLSKSDSLLDFVSDYGSGSGYGYEYESRLDSSPTPTVRRGWNDLENDFFFSSSAPGFSPSASTPTPQLAVFNNEQESVAPTDPDAQPNDFHANAIGSAVRIIGMCFGISYGLLALTLALLYLWCYRTPNEHEPQIIFNI